MIRWASISEDETYRYGLLRRWNMDVPAFATFIMLNPSTADGTVDDPTILRCIKFARSWGMGGVHVLNLYAYRATKPADLFAAKAAGVDVVGPKNDRAIRRHGWAHIPHGWPFVAAWGAHADAERVAEVLAVTPARTPWVCLGTTQSGAPKHPLARGRHRVPDDVTPQPWKGARS